MDSRLPKPSGLKRPMSVPKSILPSDRIKPSGATSRAFGAGGAAGSSLHSNVFRDVANFPNAKRQRTASPEPYTKSSTLSRAKLRRSRSACDLRDLSQQATTGAFKRNEPAKLATTKERPGLLTNRSNSTLTTTGWRRPASAPPRPVVHASTSTRLASGTRTANVRPAAVSKPTVARPVSRPGTSRPATSALSKAKAASSSTASSSSSNTKRIAPYDYKARFADLLEKHKDLKAKHEKQREDMEEYESLPTQLEETSAKLIETETTLKHTQTENECLQRQVKSQTAKIDSITCSLGNVKAELVQLKSEHVAVRKERDELNTEVVELRHKTEELSSCNAALLEELNICKEQLFQSNMERKELHNTVMDLRGNIRVFCRVRPPLADEFSRQLCGWTYHDEATVEIMNLDPQTKNKVGGSMTFNFDQVFHPNSTQVEIFELVSPMIQSALDGYNICIFAYGQTGSGKTYTMDGITQNIGVIPRTVDLIFEAITHYKRLGWEYEIRANFLEIYNEVLYDLLSNEQKDMEIRMCKSNKNDIYVSNITDELVESAEHLRELMQIAKSNRATAATAGNDRSSRSHAVTKIKLIGMHRDKQEMSVGSINLVDLAGSESPKTSQRMTETKSINRSLSELTNVILALLQKQDHIPYRNSKLTHLLMPSLGGNSKTLMFINVSPFQDCFQESVKSLRFAASVNSCKMSKAKRNRFLNTSTNSSGSEK